jgi:gamma-glutamyl-gamma-aminobutyrate hydrolase PuuD
MNKYLLLIEEHIEGTKDFHTKNVIHITGNSITELLGKFPLELNRVYNEHVTNLSNELRHSNIADDNISF